MWQCHWVDPVSWFVTVLGSDSACCLLHHGTTQLLQGLAVHCSLSVCFLIKQDSLVSKGEGIFFSCLNGEKDGALAPAYVAEGNLL